MIIRGSAIWGFRQLVCRTSVHVHLCLNTKAPASARASLDNFVKSLCPTLVDLIFKRGILVAGHEAFALLHLAVFPAVEEVNH